MSAHLIQLRRQLRLQRRQVNQFIQHQSQQQVCNQLRYTVQFKQAQNIGLYLDAFGEIHTQQLIELCWQRRKNVYLPKICPMNQQLRWVKLCPQQYRSRRFAKHGLGMREPMQNRGHSISHLDLLIMPLLACDVRGTRLGMGGGFYDRSLANNPQRPFRMGLAHEFQYLSQPLTRQPWDQALDALLSPKKLRYFKRSL